ncbi:MAG: phage portal protein [Acholeplasmatales bacterium]|nr:phage portal protein [Acholeplasmatales bacterium]
MGFLDRLAHAWNAFKQLEEPNTYRAPNYFNLGYSTTQRPDRMYFSKGNERSIITAVYNRIAIDCAAVKIQHVKMDEKDRYSDTVDSKLNTCLNLEANKDQTGRAFIQDLIQSMFDEGCVAAVPIDTSVNPSLGSYDIESMRVGKITQWYPDDVQIEVYNDRIGQKQTIMMPKKLVAIIENPLYSIMNAPNSTLQRLIRKLNILDAIDEQSGSGKLDLIIQLPYIVKTETRRQQAEKRRKDIEEQLSGSKYGIAYTDGTEKITQLNRGVDNNILNQITYLTSMLFSQLGITEEVLNGTANESTMNNYLKRTVEPIVAAVVDEFKRKFLTKTARTQKQTIMYFLDPFKLIPISNLAEFGDKFTRNEILSSNEMRQLIGFKPIKDPMADELRNKNINIKDNQKFATTNSSEVVNQITNKNLEEENNQNG